MIYWTGEPSPGMGVKIPSKIMKNSINDSFFRGNQETKESTNNQKENKLSFSFSPSRYLSPSLNLLKNAPKNAFKKSDTFSGIACEVNGVEESAAGKGAPLALYVGYVFTSLCCPYLTPAISFSLFFHSLSYPFSTFYSLFITLSFSLPHSLSHSYPTTHFLSVTLSLYVSYCVSKLIWLSVSQ